jgi:DNA primase large subunit
MFLFYLFPINSKTYIEDRKRDLISHYVLRMAYCKTEELRRWLLANESQLFAIRLGNTKASDVDKFLLNNGIKYSPITKAEKLRLIPQLMASDGNISSAQFEALDFYKVPFTEVSNLVSRRKVFLANGFAYVSRDKVSSIVLERFRASLSKSLTVACQKSDMIEGDGRIAPLVNNLAKIAF